MIYINELLERFWFWVGWFCMFGSDPAGFCFYSSMNLHHCWMILLLLTSTSAHSDLFASVGESSPVLVLVLVLVLFGHRRLGCSGSVCLLRSDDGPALRGEGPGDLAEGLHQSRGGQTGDNQKVCCRTSEWVNRTGLTVQTWVVLQVRVDPQDRGLRSDEETNLRITVLFYLFNFVLMDHHGSDLFDENSSSETN